MPSGKFIDVNWKAYGLTAHKPSLFVLIQLFAPKPNNPMLYDDQLDSRRPMACEPSTCAVGSLQVR